MPVHQTKKVSRAGGVIRHKTRRHLRLGPVFQKGRGEEEEETPATTTGGGIMETLGQVTSQATQQLSGLIGAPESSPAPQEETTQEAFEEVTSPEESSVEPTEEEPTEEEPLEKEPSEEEPAEEGGLLSQVTGALGLGQTKETETEPEPEPEPESEPKEEESSSEFATKNKETAIKTISSQLGIPEEDVMLTEEANGNGNVSVTEDGIRVENGKLLSNKSLSAGEYIAEIAFVYPSIFDGIQLLKDIDILQNARIKVSPGNENCEIVSMMKFVEYPKNPLYSIKVQSVLLQMNQAVSSNTEIVLNKELVLRFMSSKNKEITSFPVLEMGEVIEEEEEPSREEASLAETEPEPESTEEKSVEFEEDIDIEDL
jgi:hypothetical protein